MQQNISTIANVLFKVKDVSAIGNEALQSFTEKYPYAAIGYFLKAHKLRDDEALYEASSQRALTYTHNPYWLNYWMKNIQSIEKPLQSALDSETLKSAVETKIEKELSTLTSTINSSDNGLDSAAEALVFEPYHTIDYFASQGIKISKEELENDQFGQQLKRFTDWLKGMKKVPLTTLPSASLTENDDAEKVATDAAESITGAAIDTEAMAEVWVKQGKIQQAIHIYQKLSLQNPDKTHYFALKIDNLKSL